MFTEISIQDIKTLGDLKKAGYIPRSIKEEMRQNLIQKIKKKDDVFSGIWGYEDSVIPDVERALLSKHNMLFLGLRGQAKTRIARSMVSLLDEYIPVVYGSEMNDDPLVPISAKAKETILEHGDNTWIHWLHRDERYVEKLATPDVSVSDLIGDIDPIKAANMKLSYSDERVIHFGLIPRSHRCIFVINELPDLQARIQVSLFNILQEGDIQIRGFKVRYPLDISFVFTANPEDYTQRGSIVTPLKDRIESQILTHYPKTLDIGKKITLQEADIKPEQQKQIQYNELVDDIIESVAIEARKSEFVDQKSGVSARLTISALENILSTAERRMLMHHESRTFVRISDFVGMLPSITGKIELVYEGEQEGSQFVAQSLLGKAIRSLFLTYFPDPEKAKKLKINPYQTISQWFGDGNELLLKQDLSLKEYTASLNVVEGLLPLIQSLHGTQDKETQLFLAEFALHGLSEFSVISKQIIDGRVEFKDLLSGMLNFDMEEDEESQ